MMTELNTSWYLPYTLAKWLGYEVFERKGREAYKIEGNLPSVNSDSLCRL